MINRQATDIALDTGSNILVYLIHGVTGTPIEMHYVARGLSRYGWDVYATTLPGHCTRLRDLIRTNDHDWRRHVQTQLAFVRERYQTVFVAGLSAGGLLALEASTSVAVDGVGVLSPSFLYDGWNVPWTQALLPFGVKVLPRQLQYLFFYRDKAPFGIKDETLQARMRTAYSPLAKLNRQIRYWWLRWNRRTHCHTGQAPTTAATGYPIFPLKTFADLDHLLTRVRDCLSKVTVPTVILQAREDDVSSPRNAYIVYDGISSTAKDVVLLDDCYHVITVDKQKKAVVQHLIDFFRRYTADTVLYQPLSQPPAIPTRDFSLPERLVTQAQRTTTAHHLPTVFNSTPEGEPEPA
jgi:carboxylesterase